MNVAELRSLLEGLPDDAEVGAEVTLGDGTHVVRAHPESVEHEHDDFLGFDWVAMRLVTSLAEVAESDALASVMPEALEWIARHGEPLPGGWPEDCD